MSPKNDVVSALAAFEGEAMDARILGRVRGPFGCETFPEKTKDGRTLTRYRIHDASDEAMCSTYEPVYAKLIVNALNAYRSGRP